MDSSSMLKRASCGSRYGTLPCPSSTCSVRPASVVAHMLDIGERGFELGIVGLSDQVCLDRRRINRFAFRVRQLRSGLALLLGLYHRPRICECAVQGAFADHGATADLLILRRLVDHVWRNALVLDRASRGRIVERGGQPDRSLAIERNDGLHRTF